MKTNSMKLGFIGTGNMAGAIMGGIIKKGLIAPEEIIGADIMPQSRERVKETSGRKKSSEPIYQQQGVSV